MRVIGFSNQYYTLWEINTHTETSNGQNYKVTRCTYLKNISTDINKVKELYPLLEIDENLRGHSCTSFEKRERITYPLGYFNWGKYCGTKIVDCPDINYLDWAWNNFTEDEKRLLQDKMTDAGYHIFQNRLYTQKAWERHLEETKFQNSVINHELKELTLRFNLDPDGSYGVDYVKFIFPEYDTLFYNDCPYTLPILAGKRKRIKNKTIELLSYEVVKIDNPWITVKINEWKILKTK